jgi:hypothetical protein
MRDSPSCDTIKTEPIRSHAAIQRDTAATNMLCGSLYPMNKKHFTSVVWVLCAAVLLSPGCVRRRMTVRTNPPGALVYVDDQEIGTTPVSTDFTYYGTRKIQLMKDGFETMTVKQTFRPPWYEYPVIEFFSENLWPTELRDEHLLNFQMEPQQILPTERLMERAQNLRVGAQQGSAYSLPNATVTPQPVPPVSGFTEPYIAPPYSAVGIRP